LEHIYPCCFSLKQPNNGSTYYSNHLIVDVQGILFFDRMSLDVLESVREGLKVCKNVIIVQNNEIASKFYLIAVVNARTV
jgi:hypothetical protein